MKSLIDRQQDRAQRKVDNALTSTADNIGGGVGHVLGLMTDAHKAFENLSDADKAEFEAEFSQRPLSDKEVYGDLYDANGSLKTAGIGIVNPRLAGALGGFGGGDGFSQDGSGDRALPGASVGWGSPPEPSKPEGSENEASAPVSATMRVADLQAIADAEGADLSAATNNDQRVEAINANRAAKAAASAE